MLMEDMSRKKCFFQVRISHVLRFIYICDLFTHSPSYIYIYNFSWSGMRLSLIGTSATVWPIVPAPDARWVWRIWWNENRQGKLKYSIKICPRTTSSTIKPGIEPGWKSNTIYSRYWNRLRMTTGNDMEVVMTCFEALPNNNLRENSINITVLDFRARMYRSNYRTRSNKIPKVGIIFWCDCILIRKPNPYCQNYLDFLRNQRKTSHCGLHDSSCYLLSRWRTLVTSEL
jgi:hypothetical protein